MTRRDAEDRYEARLRELIAAKLKGEGLSPDPEPEADRGNVIDLMAALKASLGRGETAKPKTAPAKAAAPARRAKAASPRTLTAPAGPFAEREAGTPVAVGECWVVRAGSLGCGRPTFGETPDMLRCCGWAT